MTEYEEFARMDLLRWQQHLDRKPGKAEEWAARIQKKWNGIIPEKIHVAIDRSFQGFLSAVIFGSRLIQKPPVLSRDLEWIEEQVKQKIEFYSRTAAAEGAITGAGGFLSSLADLPLWLGIKTRMLAELARYYGHDLRDYRERVFLLDIFQLSFSGPEHGRRVYERMVSRAHHPGLYPDPETVWRELQMEYRDYIDLAKLLQLIPGIGALVGAVVNQKLTRNLGENAVQAYRMRWFAQAAAPPSSLFPPRNPNS